MFRKLSFIYFKYGWWNNKRRYWIKQRFISSALVWISTGQVTNEYLEYYEADSKCIFTYSFTSIRKIDILRKLVTSEEKEIFCLGLKISEKKIVLSVGNLFIEKNMIS